VTFEQFPYIGLPGLTPKPRGRPEVRTRNRAVKGTIIVAGVRLCRWCLAELPPPGGRGTGRPRVFCVTCKPAGAKNPLRRAMQAA
jgi:hypothetical protein